MIYRCPPLPEYAVEVTAQAANELAPDARPACPRTDASPACSATWRLIQDYAQMREQCRAL